MEAAKNKNSSFAGQKIQAAIADHIAEIKALYLSDGLPWVVGYSGGKDSTAVLQLIWLALKEVPAKERKKPVHVISTDTLVENPIVASWVNQSLQVMAKSAKKQRLPITPHRLTPKVTDSFWVNLIGKGYPAPRHKFRWCTERMKINPSNAFIRSVVHESGQAILALGTRKAESAGRSARMKKQEAKRVRERLSPNASLPNCFVYSPIENWTNDDVWLFLMQIKNPWGYENKDLLTMYQGASADGECPLVVDTTTQSCGSSRFGCWVCTLVDQDKSMTAMIQNDEEKEWMLPLLEFRNKLDFRGDEKKRQERERRDFRRMSGRVDLFAKDDHKRKDKKKGSTDKPRFENIPGPYVQSAREEWLRDLLKAQQWIRENGPSEVADIELITLDELREIRRIWVIEKHEFEDSLPSIYEKLIGEPFPDSQFDGATPLDGEDLDELKGLCNGDRLQYEMLRDLLIVEHRFRTMARRNNLFSTLEDTIRKHFYKDKTDAVNRARKRQELKSALQERDTDKLKNLTEMSATYEEITS